MHWLDVASVSGRLDRAELTSVRAALRSFQCALPLGMQDIVCIMLIFSGRGRRILSEVKIWVVHRMRQRAWGGLVGLGRCTQL